MEKWTFLDGSYLYVITEYILFSDRSGYYYFSLLFCHEFLHHEILTILTLG